MCLRAIKCNRALKRSWGNALPPAKTAPPKPPPALNATLRRRARPHLEHPEHLSTPSTLSTLSTLHPEHPEHPEHPAPWHPSAPLSTPQHP